MWKTDLKPWQENLVMRLERGLGRPLQPADLGCVVWNSGGETLTVAGRPLLGELRANNLTSNVFRTWNAGAASQSARDRSAGR
jgi:hypothetical protein